MRLDVLPVDSTKPRLDSWIYLSLDVVHLVSFQQAVSRAVALPLPALSCPASVTAEAGGSLGDH